MSITAALAMHNQASALDRISFEAQRKTSPHRAVTPHIVSLARITAEISDEITELLQHGAPSAPADRNVLAAYTKALDPLGEAITELGRTQQHVNEHALLGRRTGTGSEQATAQASRDYTLCLDAAVGAIEWAAQGLYVAASNVAPTSINMRQPAALAPTAQPMTAPPRAAPSGPASALAAAPAAPTHEVRKR